MNKVVLFNSQVFGCLEKHQKTRSVRNSFLVCEKAQKLLGLRTMTTGHFMCELHVAIVRKFHTCPIQGHTFNLCQVNENNRLITPYFLGSFL